MTRRKKVGVVLFQLGGPDRLEAVQPFLYNLFSDPDIIDFPLAWLARKPLAWFLSTLRAKHVAEHYEVIGGGSPIRELTEGQALALADALEPYVEPRVVIAMRYWHPTTAEAIGRLTRAPLDELVLLPLYPQYSRATTLSSLKEWRRRWRGPGPEPLVVERFYDHPLYLSAVVERIEQSLAEFRRPGDVHLLFSAHGLPVSLIEAGDPYQREIQETVRLVMEQGGWANPATLCYQSRLGRQKWLEPSLTATLERLAGQGVRRMLVVPISFVTEHIETLYEINLEARALAASLGVEDFGVTRGLDSSPRFIAALADIVLRVLHLESIVPAGVEGSTAT
ncbi:MAG TPA: ferrochelatase [Candidatus Acidoferrales bacterium]|nr:ferrochelatase [Candidatus Acidoferrales bacterium]